jgi:hypothetical protein
MEKIMAVENQENGVQRAPLIFIVPACGFVVAARTKQFQVCQATREQMPCPGMQRLTADLTREISPPFRQKKEIFPMKGVNYATCSAQCRPCGGQNGCKR